MPAFARTIGIDYSGAETPTASLKGLRVYLAEAGELPVEVPPPPSPRKYWTRKGIADWLVEILQVGPPTLVGIDHGFSFPLRYFETHGLPPDWPRFLDDFQHHWPTDEDHVYVDFVRDGIAGNGAARTGHSRWRRLTEERARSRPCSDQLHHLGHGRRAAARNEPDAARGYLCGRSYTDSKKVRVPNAVGVYD